MNSPDIGFQVVTSLRLELPPSELETRMAEALLALDDVARLVS
ncbi:hypothetical protein [Sphingosinicella microcystinivorans]|nr:hypothetical protein [Sphingosinicella microcystinivorans]